MNIAPEIEVSKLSRSEKVKLLEILVRDLSDEFEGIEKTEGVCGGSARIRQTRIPVWSLENARRIGLTEAELLQNFPNLTARDLANAWAYVLSNREEIEREIVENAEYKANFESDMLSFADDTDDIPHYKGTYSREEIYFDHD